MFLDREKGGTISLSIKLKILIGGIYNKIHKYKIMNTLRLQICTNVCTVQSRFSNTKFSDKS